MRLKSFHDPIKLQNFILDDALVVTPNNRLSNQLLKSSFVSSLKDVIEKPSCFSYQGLMNKLYHLIRFNNPHLNCPIILNAYQERQLWERILNEPNAFNIEVDSGLINEIQKAYANCKQWRLDVETDAFSLSNQSEFFKTMAIQFDEALKTLGAITSSQLFEFCIEHLSALPIKQMVWACFNDFTPAQIALQDALIANGIELFEYDLKRSNTNAAIYAAKDETDETTQMIAWVKQKQEAHHQKISVVIPDIQKQFKSLRRVFAHHFKEHEITISLGEPLANMSLVSHALSLISLNHESLDHETARMLTQTPYIRGSRTEFLERSELLQSSAWFKEYRIPFRSFLYAIKHKTPQLFEQLSQLEVYPSHASPRDWVSLFKSRLEKFGFPGEYSLDSRNYQIYKRFELLFDEFLQLSLIHQRLSKTDAIKSFSNLASTTIFQIQKADTPILVLGILEASGCDFDCLWVSGMDDQCLPEKTKPSPFIPLHIQRTLDMPKINPAKELQLAQKTITRFMASAKECVFSYPRLQGETPGLPSPIIKHFKPYDPLELPPMQPSSKITFDESYTHPLQPDENYSGGSAILANQAKCPFKAFAANRLHAKRAPTLNVGPDALERGQVIHKIMEMVWKALKNQSRLLQIDQIALDQIISDAVAHALQHELKNRHHSFSKIIHTIEDTRLKKLVQACLEWEKMRPPFTVEGIEQAHEITLAGLNFKLRVDRLDKVSDNFWVIDYKTTMPSSKPWNAERPQEPQLLLYGLLNPDIDGLLFLQLKSGQVKVGGISKEPTDLKGLNSIKNDESWSDYRENWHQELLSLAKEFKSGHCPPTPKTSSTCQLCDFPTLCRINT